MMTSSNQKSIFSKNANTLKSLTSALDERRNFCLLFVNALDKWPLQNKVNRVFENLKYCLFNVKKTKKNLSRNRHLPIMVCATRRGSTTCS